MKKIDLGQTVHTLANVGVIAGIIFLGVEISQNNDELASQSRNTMYQMRSNLSEPLIDNRGGIADLLSKHARGELLTESEARRIRARREHIVRTLEYMFLEDPERTMRAPGWTSSLFYGDAEFLEDYWDSTGGRNPDFAEWFEEAVIPRMQWLSR